MTRTLGSSWPIKGAGTIAVGSASPRATIVPPTVICSASYPNAEGVNVATLVVPLAASVPEAATSRDTGTQAHVRLKGGRIIIGNAGAIIDGQAAVSDCGRSGIGHGNGDGAITVLLQIE